VVTSATQNQPQAILKLQGRAVTFNTNDIIPTQILVFIPCANGGAGEDVLLSGNLHALNTFTINNNMVKGSYHFQPQGISGMGSITGDKYQATGETQGDFKGAFINGQYQESSTNNFKIIGQGNGNNYLIHENFHITINANGELTTVIDNFTVDCK